MKDYIEYQQMFNDNLLGGISFYLINNPVISWSSGFVQGLTGLCFLIALMDAIGSLDSSKEFARKMLTLSLCLLVVLANFGVVNPREIINFNLSPTYDYMNQQNKVDMSKSLLAKLDIDSSKMEVKPTLDRDVFNALRQFFDSLSVSLRNAMNVKMTGGKTDDPVKKDLQTFAYEETIWLVKQASWARLACNLAPDNNDGFIRCLNDKVPLEINSNKDTACGGEPCQSETAQNEKEIESGASRFIPDIMIKMGAAIINLLTYLQLVFANFAFMIVFPVVAWILEVIRSVVSIFLIIGYGLGTAGMLVFAKLVSPMLLLPKERGSILNAYRTLYALTLFGFVTDLFMFFTSLLMMGLHYATYSTFKQLFTDAANSSSAMATVQFSYTFYQLTMVIYFTIFVILIINIIALGKIKETCLALANFSFSKLVSLGGELVSSGISAAGKIGLAVVGGAAVGGTMLAKGAMGAGKGVLANSTRGRSLLDKVGRAKTAVGEKAKAFSGYNKVQGAWEGSGAQKLTANAKLGFEQGAFGDKGQKEVFSRNFADSVLKNNEDKKEKEKKDNIAALVGEKNKKSGGGEGGSSEGSGSSDKGGVSAKSARGTSAGKEGDNFDANTSGGTGTNEASTSTNKLVGDDSVGSSGTGEGKRTSATEAGMKKLRESKDQYKNMYGNIQKYGNKALKLVESGSRSGNTNEVTQSVVGSVEKGAAKVAGLDEANSKKLESIYQNQDLIEAERNKLDMTDSGVALNNIKATQGELSSIGYETDKNKITKMDSSLVGADIYNEEGNLDEKSLNDEILQNAFSVESNYNDQSMAHLSENARNKLVDIQSSKAYVKFKDKELARARGIVKKASSNTSYSNTSNLAKAVQSGLIGANTLNMIGQGNPKLAEELKKNLEKVNSSASSVELGNIVDGLNSNLSSKKEEAEQRRELYTSSGMSDIHSSLTGKGASDVREKALQAGIISREEAKALESGEKFNQFTQEAEEAMKSMSTQVSENALENGLRLAYIENGDTGSMDLKISDGNSSVLVQGDGIDVNNIQEEGLRHKLIELKQDLDKIFAYTDVENTLNPDEYQRLLKLKDKIKV